MTYDVDVGGKFTIIQEPPEKLKEDWEDFKIKKLDEKTTRIHLEGRTPWYPDIVAKLYVLGQYYKGRLLGHGEDGDQIEVDIPPTKGEIINASERKIWGMILAQRDMKEDRFYHELQEIGFEELYPEWLKQIPKRVQPLWEET